MGEYAIDRAEALRYMGFRGQELDSRTLERIDAMRRACLRDAQPDYTWAVYDLERDEKGIRLHGTDVYLTGGDIAKHLDGAKKCALMAATLGHRCDLAVRRLEARSITDAVIYNACTVALIESVSDRCQRELGAKIAPEGLYVNGRYSPGYGDFPLDFQKALLSLTGADVRLGITLTEGLLMLPRKSVTAVLGLFPEDGVSRSMGRGCRVCAMREFCEYRKSGEHCG